MSYLEIQDRCELTGLEKFKALRDFLDDVEIINLSICLWRGQTVELYAIISNLFIFKIVLNTESDLIESITGNETAQSLYDTPFKIDKIATSKNMDLALIVIEDNGACLDVYSRLAGGSPFDLKNENAYGRRKHNLQQKIDSLTIMSGTICIQEIDSASFISLRSKEAGAELRRAFKLGKEKLIGFSSNEIWCYNLDKGLQISNYLIGEGKDLIPISNTSIPFYSGLVSILRVRPFCYAILDLKGDLWLVETESKTCNLKYSLKDGLKEGDHLVYQERLVAIVRKQEVIFFDNSLQELVLNYEFSSRRSLPISGPFRRLNMMRNEDDKLIIFLFSSKFIEFFIGFSVFSDQIKAGSQVIGEIS
eukprot:TRINITY_DN6271_c0_g1_i13.p1 TRINITY_DN6271_c0_g1~~TRINITY_DN6271_c0_g1_i13.p1  ORF type:complete len:363 (-),score=37.52 TRINITY_DN6271_c0_g1_i13:617-1705(-)